MAADGMYNAGNEEREVMRNAENKNCINYIYQKYITQNIAYITLDEIVVFN